MSTFYAMKDVNGHTVLIYLIFYIFVHLILLSFLVSICLALFNFIYIFGICLNMKDEWLGSHIWTICWNTIFATLSCYFYYFYWRSDLIWKVFLRTITYGEHIEAMLVIWLMGTYNSNIFHTHSKINITKHILQHYSCNKSLYKMT